MKFNSPKNLVGRGYAHNILRFRQAEDMPKDTG